MRISDWSSDVCSSDLVKYFELTAKCEVCGVDMTFPGVPDVGQSPDKPMVNIDATEIRFPVIAMGEKVEGKPAGFTLRRDRSADPCARSEAEERRAGQECVGPCGYRWAW